MVQQHWIHKQSGGLALTTGNDITARLQKCVADAEPTTRSPSFCRPQGGNFETPRPRTSTGSSQTSNLKTHRAARVENHALAQNAVHKPAFFQLKNLIRKCAAFVFCNRHGIAPNRFSDASYYMPREKAQYTIHPYDITCKRNWLRQPTCFGSCSPIPPSRTIVNQKASS